MVIIRKTVRLVAAAEPAFTGTCIDIRVSDISRTFGLGSIILADDVQELSIDWGDGSASSRFTESAALITHEYAAGGRYAVRISDGARSVAISTGKTPDEYVTAYAPMIVRVVSEAERLTTINPRAFKGATSLVEARFKSVNSIAAPNVSTVPFVRCDALAEIHFAAANEETIRASTGWMRSEGTFGAKNATVYFDL